jgi:hypothetical protein
MKGRAVLKSGNALEVDAPAIRSKIETARGLFLKWGREIPEDPHLRLKIERVREKSAASRTEMLRSGISDACRRCDEEDGGSCCGAGIEDRYSPTLLLMNLVLGGTLPSERRFEKSCFFLGERGCTLTARDTLCLNYICLPAQKKIPLDDLVTLQNTVGEEIDALFALQEALKKWLVQK